MLRNLSFALLLTLTACDETPAPTPASNALAPAETAIDLAADQTTCAICGTWKATSATVNGKVDTERDPTGKVEWVLRADSTFTMRDATEGTEEKLEGRWRLTKDKVLQLIAPNDEGTLPFGVRKLADGELVLQVMEDNGGAEVLLFFKSE